MFPVLILYHGLPYSIVTDLTQPMSATGVLKLWLEWQGISKEHHKSYTAKAITSYVKFEAIKTPLFPNR